MVKLINVTMCQKCHGNIAITLDHKASMISHIKPWGKIHLSDQLTREIKQQRIMSSTHIMRNTSNRLITLSSLAGNLRPGFI